MKTLIKVSNLKLIKNSQGIMLVHNGAVISKFTKEQLLPAIVALLSLTTHKNNTLSGNKIINSFQPSLF